MRSKLAAQPQAAAPAAPTDSAQMLERCHGMFAGSLQQVHAAMQELRRLQRFVRFNATPEDVAEAGAGIYSFWLCDTLLQVNDTLLIEGMLMASADMLGIEQSMSSRRGICAFEAEWLLSRTESPYTAAP